jgi:hypothetical protein
VITHKLADIILGIGIDSDKNARQLTDGHFYVGCLLLSRHVIAAIYALNYQIRTR